MAPTFYPPQPGQNPPACEGNPFFGANLSSYSDGSLAVSLTAYTTPVTGAAQWTNAVTYGELLSSSVPIATYGGLPATSVNDQIAEISFATGPHQPGGYYQVIGSFSFTPMGSDCEILLNYGSPGFVPDGQAYTIPYAQSFNISTNNGGVDPTPYIDSVTLDRPLISGDTSVATITGGNFGINLPTVTLACSSGNTSAPCTSTDVTAVVNPSMTNSSVITATLTASGAAEGNYDLTVTSNGTPTYGNFQQGPGTTAQATKQKAVGVALANMVLQLNDTVINSTNNYSEDSTIQVTAVRPDTGATIPTFVGTVDLAEIPQEANGGPVYIQNGGNLPPNVPIAAGKGGSATFVAQSLAGPNKAGNDKPVDAQIQTSNYQVYGGGTLAIPQWIITSTGDEDEIDPRAGAPTYDWFETRARDIFDANPIGSGNLATVLGAVQYYTTDYLTDTYGTEVLGLAPPTRSAQSPIQINPFFALVRTNITSQYTRCSQSFTHEFTDVLVHEARHAYQYAQTIAKGQAQNLTWLNDQDGDWLVETEGAAAPMGTTVDSTTSRPVCNESTMTTGGPGAVFSVPYKGDSIADPFGPGLAGDTSADVDYALELDANTYSSNNNPGDPQ